MDDLSRLPNIGPVLARKLCDCGIRSYDDLVEVGSVGALLRITGRKGGTHCNMLYALEGAIRGIRWHGIPKDERAKLRAALRLDLEQRRRRSRPASRYV